MHCLDAPTARDKLRRQPIEQLGVARCRPGLAEVVGSGYDSLAEMEQPDPVDHHACGERMTGLSQPLRKCQPAAACASTCSREPTRRMASASRWLGSLLARPHGQAECTRLV